MTGIPEEEPERRNGQRQYIQENEKDIGSSDAAIEIALAHDSPLCRDVELAKLGIDEGEQSRPEDVRGENGFVNFIPEGITVFPLNAHVRHIRQEEVRH